MENFIKYYHGLAGGIPYWHRQDVLNEGLKQLKDILQLDGIHCRRKLSDYGISYDEKDPVYNGDDYISICIDYPDEDEFTGENADLDSAFFRYVRYKIGIEFKSCMVETFAFRKEPYRHLPGERQVLGSIGLSNISRITVGIGGDLEGIALIEVRKLCEPYQIPVMTWKKIQYQEQKVKLFQK